MSQLDADDRGFTLLELLVALVVLGFVLAGIAGGVQFGQRAADMQARSIAAHADMGAADRLLRRLVAAMDAGSRRKPAELHRRGPPRSASRRIGQRRRGDRGRGGRHRHGRGRRARLVLRWEPALHAVRLGPPPVPQTSVLLDGMERVEFAYWGHGEGGGGQWLARWTEKDIPALIRIRLHFLPAARRSWPDIIAATERICAAQLHRRLVCLVRAV